MGSGSINSTGIVNTSRDSSRAREIVCVYVCVCTLDRFAHSMFMHDITYSGSLLYLNVHFFSLYSKGMTLWEGFTITFNDNNCLSVCLLMCVSAVAEKVSLCK